MLNNIFNPDNFVFRPMGRLVDVVVLSVMWFFTSLVLIPFGPSTAALYDVMAKCMVKGEQGPYARYLRTMKENFKTGCPAGLIVLLLTFDLWFLRSFLYARAAEGSQTFFVLYAASWVLMVAVSGVLAYIFPVLSRFEFRLGGLFATCCKLAAAHLPTTLLLGLTTTLCVLACATWWVTIFFIPYLWARLACLLLERVFRPYMKQDQAEEPAED